jgi:hypothetical protein
VPSLDVVAPGKVIAVAEEDRRPQSGIVIEIVVGLGQAVKRLWVDTVEHLRAVDADEDYLLAPLNRDLGVDRARDIGHALCIHLPHASDDAEIDCGHTSPDWGDI